MADALKQAAELRAKFGIPAPKRIPMVGDIVEVDGVLGMCIEHHKGWCYVRQYDDGAPWLDFILDEDRHGPCKKAWRIRDDLSHPEPEPEAVQVPQGWRLVPEEPTPKMLQAGRHRVGSFSTERWFAASYRAMLAATPQPPAQAEARGGEPIGTADIVDGMLMVDLREGVTLHHGDALYARPAPAAPQFEGPILSLLLEAGHVTQRQVDQARAIAAKTPGFAPAAPQAGEAEDGAFLMQIVAAADEVKTWPQWLQDMALPLQASQPMSREGMSRAAQDVLAERRRQIEAEGWTPEHDDEHGLGELARAAACYALHAASQASEHPGISLSLESSALGVWPWDQSWHKPGDQRRNLVKAGALTLAELERLDRASANGIGPGSGEGVA